MFLYLGEMRII